MYLKQIYIAKFGWGSLYLLSSLFPWKLVKEPPTLHQLYHPGPIFLYNLGHKFNERELTLAKICLLLHEHSASNRESLSFRSISQLWYICGKCFTIWWEFSTQIEQLYFHLKQVKADKNILQTFRVVQNASKFLEKKNRAAP